MTPQERRGAVRQLLALGYSLSATARYLGIPVSTAAASRDHSDFVTDPLSHPPPPPTPPVPDLPFPTRALSPLPLPPERALLADLAPRAARFRAGTPSASPTADAHRRLSSLLRHLHHERGIPIQVLADASGLSYQAVRNRISS